MKNKVVSYYAFQPVCWHPVENHGNFLLLWEAVLMLMSL